MRKTEQEFFVKSIECKLVILRIEIPVLKRRSENIMVPNLRLGP